MFMAKASVSNSRHCTSVKWKTACGSVPAWIRFLAAVILYDVKSAKQNNYIYRETCFASYKVINLLAPEFYIEILAHPVCKM
jgi:hypothetical protein